MNWIAVLFRVVLTGIAGLGFYAFFSSISFLCSATAPLIAAELRQDYFLKAGTGFAGFLVCGVGMVWLLSRGRDSMNRFLANEEEAK
jgi:hypothetical protein